jgi:malonyl-CoA O-methyltransferase
MIDEPGEFALNRRWARRSFERAAPTYDAAAALPAEARGELLKRLDPMSIAPRLIVDAGAATGHASRALARRYPGSQVLALDFSPAMLREARRQQGWRRRFQRVCADASFLPLADGSVDLLFSNLLLPWCEPEGLLGEFRRVLRPEGLLALSGLGPDTLGELRQSWAEADAGPHVHAFIDMHDLGDALVRAGFAAPVLDVERYTLFYSSVRALLDDLRYSGARNALSGRARGLTGPKRFAAMGKAYERHRRDGRLPATYEVVFGHAWAPKLQEGAFDGDAMSLEAMRRQLRSRRAP